MSRTRRVVIAILVCLCAARVAHAQAPAGEGWVVLPVDEYRALRARAVPELPTAISPPVDATLTRIDYELRADGEAIAGRALLTVDVLREGWVKVPIPTGLRVRDARLDGQPVPLIEGPPSHVMLSRTGRSVLSLEISLPVAAASGTESITLPSSSAPVSRATLSLPRGGVDLTVTGGFVSERSESAAESRWTALGRANQPLTFSWKRKADDRRAEMPLRFRARIASSIGLGEEVSSISSVVRIEVQQGLAREVSLAMPAGLVVNQVNGATVADWTVKGSLLTVRLLDPVATELSFVVQSESRLPADGDITVPLVRVPAAEREIGGVAISVLGAGEIEKHQMRGLEPGDVSDLADIIAGHDSPSTVAFRLRPATGTDLRSLNISVKRYTPQAVLIANIEEARYRVLAAEDGLFLVEARYAIRNNQRSFLKVTLPARATIWSASVAGKPVRPGVAEGEAVLLPLEKGRAGEDAPTFAVHITYLQPVDPWLKATTARIDLPALDLPISRTGVELYHSPRFRVEPQAGAFRVEADPGVFADALRGGRGYGFGLSSGGGGSVPPMPAAPPVAAPDAVQQMTPADEVAGKTTQFRMLIDRYRNEGGGRTVSGALPIDVSFPTMGPSLFMASELTPESDSPAINLSLRRVR
ncbi:MAG TPA: hypothetical protein VM096_16285 [Vicinamibacterales bacterium]|nr:hypothetical protein [Vicinamibacterales bacterium]